MINHAVPGCLEYAVRTSKQGLCIFVKVGCSSLGATGRKLPGAKFMTWIQFATPVDCSNGVGNLPQISLIGPRARSAGSRSPKFEECWAFSFIRCSSILSTVLRTFRPDIPTGRAWEFPLPLVLSTTVTAVEFEHFPWAHKMPAS